MRANDKKQYFSLPPFRHTSLYFINMSMPYPFFNIYGTTPRNIATHEYELRRACTIVY